MLFTLGILVAQRNGLCNYDISLIGRHSTEKTTVLERNFRVFFTNSQIVSVCLFSLAVHKPLLYHFSHSKFCISDVPKISQAKYIFANSHDDFQISFSPVIGIKCVVIHQSFYRSCGNFDVIAFLS